MSWNCLQKGKGKGKGKGWGMNSFEQPPGQYEPAQVQPGSAPTEEAPINFNFPLKCLEVKCPEDRRLRIRPAWKDQWDVVTPKPPPGLPIAGPKTEAQVKAEEKKKIDDEASRKEMEAINKDFRQIYGWTEESAKRRRESDN